MDSSLEWTCAHASPQSVQCGLGSNCVCRLSNCVCRPRKYFLTVELYQIRCAHSSISWIQAWRDVCTCIPSVCTMRNWVSNCVCRPRKYFLTVELYQIRCAHSSLSWIQAWRDVCTCIPSVSAMRTGSLIVFAVQESTS